ncbi:uncharacterized protein CANTADRAFT_25856 [Suhomyces tanzawaensis NRRL Y-17324]|uniref:Uncharacterized protein n=1 Tax=Suhomyces tanzawaensis NRRL Y-17324 TaxID=984487 RepID=A0A1E4SKY3_9ASCO|nr:uncharacterized protein CANTADRAFT_25856 [Suhomyces tanzawaensis NRRL Y-17324]ODV80150.1 hypothetical protein CANTADRAFT_25856 [Suhomyces tanzawaensis NRRL Y-17324]
MLSRSLRSTRLVFKRLEHTNAGSFTNKHNFNINPPPVHEYWNYRNASVLLAFIPVYLSIGYFAKYIGANTEGYQGLQEFADNEKSPLKELKFGEPQTSK